MSDDSLGIAALVAAAQRRAARACLSCGGARKKQNDMLCLACWAFVDRPTRALFMVIWRLGQSGLVAAELIEAFEQILGRDTAARRFPAGGGDAPPKGTRLRRLPSPDVLSHVPTSAAAAVTAEAFASTRGLKRSTVSALFAKLHAAGSLNATTVPSPHRFGRRTVTAYWRAA